MGKVLDIGLWGIFGPSPRLLFWEPFILGEVPHIELWAFQAPPGGCYLGKVVDIGLLGLLASIVGKVVDIVGLLEFLASIMGKVLDIAGLLEFLASIMGKVLDIAGLLRFLALPPLPTNLKMGPQIRKALYIENLLC